MQLCHRVFGDYQKNRFRFCLDFILTIKSDSGINNRAGIQEEK